MKNKPLPVQNVGVHRVLQEPLMYAGGPVQNTQSMN